MQKIRYKGMASVLAPVTDMEVTKTVTSFLPQEALDSCLHTSSSFCCKFSK